MSAIQTKYPAAQAILNDAEQMARETLGLNQEPLSNPSSDSVVHHHYHYYRDPFWYWTPRQTVTVNCGNGTPVPASGKKKDSKNADALLISIASAVVFMAASWFIAGAARELKNLNLKRDELDLRQALTVDEGSAQTVKPVVEGQKRLIIHQKEEAKIGLFLKGGVLASAAATGTGAFVSPILLSAGILAGVAAATAMVVHSGYKEGDTTQQQEADKLLASVAHARNFIRV